MRSRYSLLALSALSFSLAAASDQVKIASGTVEGSASTEPGIRAFKGIPFAQPPVGELRWKAPQPLESWSGVKQTAQFGPRCMQQALFGDMNFRSDGMKEDCLYLNVWTPATSSRAKLPVLVYFFGGGFQAGDGSEPRYDGESIARKGIVAVTVNYRLGVFGFLAHPDLTKETPHHSSGNYALLDQNAALAWVHRNIAEFGGDPRKVTIAGESAGSIAVSAQMASPLSKDLIAGAIGESGSILGALPPVPLAKGEEQGAKFAESLGAASIAALRAMPASDILEAAGKRGVPRFSAVIDGYFFPQSPIAIFETGKQAHVPLLAGWNSEESNARGVLGRDEPTPENLGKGISRLYPDHSAEIAKEYAASSNEEAREVATALAGDRFIAYSTWKWIELAAKTGGKPVYRYYYAKPRPPMKPEAGNVTAGLAGGVIPQQPGAAPAPVPRGAVHSAEIEYALGNLDGNKVYAWTPEDRKVSAAMEDYFANFIKTGDPNGAGLPKWPKANGGSGQLLRIDVTPRAETDAHPGRYRLLDKLATAQP